MLAVYDSFGERERKTERDRDRGESRNIQSFSTSLSQIHYDPNAASNSTDRKAFVWFSVSAGSREYILGEIERFYCSGCANRAKGNKGG